VTFCVKKQKEEKKNWYQSY